MFEGLCCHLARRSVRFDTVPFTRQRMTCSHDSLAVGWRCGRDLRHRGLPFRRRSRSRGKTKGARQSSHNLYDCAHGSHQLTV
ncbi:hypothetical protein EVAR_46463_1 [Eumeta japonica]|uniref:Uncharacterized protein n=1 Tax=Eumeta variegata TaxID=151549 RepID=A0A4C1XJE6_EUMVA|nr:hypothetical protein EVAR_46463_1 [Eumeta japonica]